jgi:hypothetical protein
MNNSIKIWINILDTNLLNIYLVHIGNDLKVKLKKNLNLGKKILEKIIRKS